MQMLIIVMIVPLHYCPCSMAPWCPACRGLQPIWDEFGGWSEDLDIGVGQVDVTSSPGLSGRFMVTALPTIFHVKVVKILEGVRSTCLRFGSLVL